jgi:hypothetical protein
VWEFDAMSTLTKQLQSSLEAWSLSMQTIDIKVKQETFEEKYNIQIKCCPKQ